MSEQLTGGCLCRAVRYRLGPLLYPATFCHCESCRRAAGAHVVAWLTVAARDFECTAGAPRDYESSTGVRRGFCEHCGTPLTYRCSARPAEVDVTVGSLDAPSGVAPADHIWMVDAPAWDRPDDGLPSHQGRRPP